MNLEIHKRELVQRVKAYIQTGHFHDADDVLEKALDALGEKATAPSTGQAAKPDDTRTGADLVAALQASPHLDLDIEPARCRESTPLRDVTF
jgi:Arc/MetJ-type ribon-helix-helix transcriptional regulator